MKRYVAGCAAALAFAGLAAMPQSRTEGSAVPCAVPIAWRVARVDDEFGLSVAEVTGTIEQAADMWQGSTRRALFSHDPEDGFPIRLVYDERQARTDERSRREGDLREARARLDAAGEELVRRGDQHAETRARFTERQREYERRVAELNVEVRRWNERGGAPEDLAERLDSVARVLRTERATLDAERRALQADLAALQEQVDRVNRANAEHARREDELVRDFPALSMEAGEYREAVRMEGRRVAAVGREIRIYRSSSADELRLIVAHELGHALGLGHTEEPMAVMSPAHDSGAEGRGVNALHEADLEMLRTVCPQLGVRSR